MGKTKGENQNFLEYVECSRLEWIEIDHKQLIKDFEANIGANMKRIIFTITILSCLLSSCVSNKFEKWNVNQVLDCIKENSLEIENPKVMSEEDYGLRPMVAEEGLAFDLPATCRDCGGRIYSFSSEEDLDVMKKYYEKIGMIFKPAWVIEKDNILVTLSNKVPEEKVNIYTAALNELEKTTKHKNNKKPKNNQDEGQLALSSGTDTPQPTSTPSPTITRTPKPTSTPTPALGSFVNPLHLGASIIVNPISQELIDQGIDPNLLGEMECTLLEVVNGKEALDLAKKEGKYSVYDPLLEGQEYLGVRVRIKQISSSDPNNVQTIYPYWHLTLRDENEGPDVWSEAFVDIFAQGYVPIEGEGWVLFKIKEGSTPYLYFSPWLMQSEQVGIRDTGAYFQLFKNSTPEDGFSS